jgi:hypothetical protein
VGDRFRDLIEMADPPKRPDGQDFSSMRPALQEEFEQTWRKPRSWVRNGDLLRAAAAALRPSVEDYWRKTKAALERMREPPEADQPARVFSPPREDPTPAHGMLLGFAAENYLKSIWVCRHGRVTEAAKPGKLPTKILQHDLVSLLHELIPDGFGCDKSLLWRLGELVQWAGRYPTSATAQNFDPQYRSSRDAADSAELVEKIRSLAMREIEDRERADRR